MAEDEFEPTVRVERRKVSARCVVMQDAWERPGVAAEVVEMLARKIEAEGGGLRPHIEYAVEREMLTPERRPLMRRLWDWLSRRKPPQPFYLVDVRATAYVDVYVSTETVRAERMPSSAPPRRGDGSAIARALDGGGERPAHRYWWQL